MLPVAQTNKKWYPATKMQHEVTEKQHEAKEDREMRFQVKEKQHRSRGRKGHPVPGNLWPAGIGEVHWD